MGYRILTTNGDAANIPDWVRTPPKWQELVDKALDLEPGKYVQVEFDDLKAAKRARNAVRDMANLKAGKAIIRTRLVTNDDSATLYIVRVHEGEGLEAALQKD